MNASLFRLVFNRVRGAYVPASEATRSHSRSGRRALRGSVAALVAACTAIAPMASAQSPLDGTLPIAAQNWISSGQAALDYAANVMTITQGSQRVILNWDSFNIAAGRAVNFVQPDASAAALNRIGGGVPSVIAGQLNANGQIYLLNPNGILFDRGAQINVGGLIASALNIPDATFNRGLLSVPVGEAAFSWGGTLEQYNVTQIVVRPDARLSTTVAGGSIMMFAPRIVNEGTISTPDGQTMLAAGAKIFLTAPLDSTLRGFLVEVDPFLERDASGQAIVAQGGSVTNEAVGRIVAERGNVTLASLAVNQNGRVSATTSVRLNGSVYLQARDTVSLQTGIATVVENNVTVPRGLRTGKVSFGEGSTTEVLPELRDAQTIQDSQSFTPSTINVVGSTVHLKRDSVIAAPGGIVNVTALAGQIFQTPGAPAADGVRVYLEQGSRIDVAGTRSTTVSVERNFIEAELRGNELRDSPLQRDSFLRGSTVTVDIRKGTPLADVSGYVGQVARTVEERSSIGGTITIRSEGDVVLRQGSILDVSGGRVTYTAGIGSETLLAGADGRVYRMSEASPDRIYTGFADRYTVTDPRGGTQTWRPRQSGEFLAGYAEGKDAGSVTLTAHAIALEGQLLGGSTPGAYQREAGTIPRGGELILGDATQASAPQADFKLAGIQFTRQLDRLASSFTADDALPAQWRERAQVDTATFSVGGFTRMRAFAKGAIVVPAGVDLTLAPGGSLAVTGRELAVNGNITAPSGSIVLATREVAGGGLDPAHHGLKIGAGVVVSAAGLWVNDAPGVRAQLGTDPILVDGGTVTLSSAADLLLGPSSVIDVSGGVHVGRDRSVRAGAAGDIALSSGRVGLSDTDRQSSRIELAGTLRGYALGGGGGSLSLSTSSIMVGGIPSAAVGELRLDPSFFGQGGFRRFSLSGRDSLSIAPGTLVVPRQQSWQLSQDDFTRATGSALFDFSDRVVLPDFQRAPMAISLSSPSTVFGSVDIGAGSRITVDPGGEIAVASGRQVTVHGTLEAPAGSIAIGNARPGGTESFEADVSVWLAASSRLLATGYLRLTPDARGLRTGEVLDGGRITLSALKGYLVAEPGSVIDVSGVSGELDLARDSGVRSVTARTAVAGSAGSVTLEAREGLLFDGQLRAGPGGAGAAGGSLAVFMDELPILFFPSNAREIVLTDRIGFVPIGLRPGQAVEADPFDPAAPINGKAFVSASAVAGAGFDSLSLKAGDAIRIETPVDLSLRRSLLLDAPSLIGEGTGTARLTAAYIALGNTDITRQATTVPTAGLAQLDVHARLIDIIGTSSIGGFDVVNLASSGDIRLRGVVVDTDPTINGTTYGLVGSLVSAADLVLEAAQAYPTTLSRYTLSVTGRPSGRITFQHAPTPTTGPVLSAAGSLRVEAHEIHQNGVLKAPFGAIELVAANQVTLGVGSVTSVSGEGQTIPFGRTELSGIDYVYAFGPGFGNLILEAPPEKRVFLDAPSIEVEGTIDLTGGGDLFAYEFTPGPGGSRNVLDPVNAPGAFAVLPSVGSGFGPSDHQYSIGVDGLAVGDQVYLSGVSGLPDGVYTLLPARYALLPGGYLVTPAASTLDLQPSAGMVLPDNSQLVSGYRMTTHYDGSIARDGRTSGFYVASGAVLNERAEYRETRGDTFFADVPTAQLPADAGRLAMSAAQALVLNGTVLGSGLSGRRGAEVDIAAPKLAVVAPGVAAPDQYLALDTAQVNRLGASSLLLGGLRTRTAGGIRIDAGLGASDSRVWIGTNADNPLTAVDVLLAATGEVTLTDGSSIVGQASETAALPGTITVTGNGALVRVSSDSLAVIERSAFDRSLGTVRVGENVQLSSPGSVVLDATRDTFIADSAKIETAAVSVSAGRVSLGEVPAAAEGLVLTQSLLAQLGGQATLGVKSYSSIDLYGSVTLGGVNAATALPLVRDLRLDAAAVGGYGAGDKVIRAQSITLINSSGAIDAPFATVPDGTGSLRFDATGTASGQGVLVIGGGDKAFDGFGSLLGRASGEIRFSGSGTLRTDSFVSLETGRIVATADAEQALVAVGELATVSIGTTSDDAAVGLGGRLRLSGSRISHGGRIEMPAGSVVLEATGTDAADGVTLLAGSILDLAGRSIEFTPGAARASSGGTARLSALRGDVIIGQDALVTVAAGGEGADGGLLEIEVPQGSLLLGGRVLGSGGGAAARGGRVSVDVATLDDFGATELAFAVGGFDESRRYRVRSGDVAIASDTTVQANSILISVDAGSISLAGSLDASGTNGGRVELWARDSVALLGTAGIDASAATVDGKGGRIVLGTSTGVIDLAAGARLSVAGSERQGGREIVLRAPRIGGDLAIQRVDAEFSSGAAIIAEAFRVYDHSSLGSAEFAAIAADSDAYMASAVGVRGRLTALTAMRAGVEVRSSGDLMLTSDWNLFSQRPGGEPGLLTLRAAGDLLLSGSLSDAFTSSTHPGGVNPSTQQLNPVYLVQPGESWSYRLVGGADQGAADPLAVIKSEVSGDVVLAENRFVRTGSGTIDVAAGRDIVMTSVRSTIYTAGAPGPSVPGFAASSIANIPTPSYTERGGDIRVSAGRDVRAAPSNQLVSEWLYRDVKRAGNALRPNPQSTWWVRFDMFQQGIGALGGGDIEVSAGRDVDHVSAVIPTNGRVYGDVGLPPEAANFIEQGGGSLTVRAGRDVLGGVYYVQRGEGLIEAGRSVGLGVRESGPALNTILALGDAQVMVRALKDATLETAFNPTVVRQARPNTGTTGLLTTYFFTYGRNAALDVQSTAGVVRLSNDRDLLTQLPGSPLASRTDEAASALVYPGITRLTAFSGDVVVSRPFTLFPSEAGQLELLAEGSVLIGGTMNMSDVSPDALPRALSPDIRYTDRISPLLVNASEQGPLFHAEAVLHRAYVEPVYIVARTGDVAGPVDPETGISPFGTFAKPVRIVAGRDVRDVWVYGQNVRPNDVTLVEAGRDFRYTTLRTTLGEQRTNNGRFEIGGPGEVQVNAGRNIDLGNSGGLVTRGNFNNPFLPESGASIRIGAGAVDGDYDGFIDAYLEGGRAGTRQYRSELAVHDLFRSRGRSLSATDALSLFGNWLTPSQRAVLSASPSRILTESEALPLFLAAPAADRALMEADALARFKLLGESEQTAFINQVLYAELKQTGRDYTSARADDYLRGYRAILTLYPLDDAQGTLDPATLTNADLDRMRSAAALRYPGDVSLFFSQIKTEQGGDIEMRVPGGLVNAGLANPGSLPKSASELGIVTVRGGSIRATVAEDFLVNQSRVFTLQGGDILLWASYGDIDAGRGEKTATATPPPQVVFRGDRFVLDTSRSVEGSGIGVLLGRDDIVPGDVDLIAPRGEVNAGDAGIRVAGNLNIAALQVVNAQNISVGGASSGVPAASSGSVAGLGGVSSVANEATRSVQETTSQVVRKAVTGSAEPTPSFLTVEVIGLGDDDDERKRKR